MKNTKIRSWNKFENHFFYFQNGKYFKDSDCKKCVSERICSEFMWSNAEWCTELHDKNGKEIYENDLVQDAVLIFKVEWNQQNSKFCINPVGRVDGDFDGIIESIMYADLGNGYYSRKDLEIIGNIHEHEQLLSV